METIKNLEEHDIAEDLVGVKHHNFKATDPDNDDKPVVTFEKPDSETVMSPGRLAIQRFMSNKIAVVGLIVFVLILLMVIFVPIFSSTHINDFNLQNPNQPPSATHWFGTDLQGRDVFFRVFLGGRVSMQVGFIATIIAVALGTIIGSVSGFYGGKVDAIVMRFCDIFMSLPTLPIMLSLAAVMIWAPEQHKVFVTAGIIGIFGWTGLARLIRGQILSLREQEFMQATEALGLNDSSKIFRHLLPNVVSLIIVNATLGLAGAILAESALSFLGMGVVPPTPTWGNLMQLAMNTHNLRNFPWVWVPAGIMCFLTVVSINLVGEGLRDAFDPKAVK